MLPMCGLRAAVLLSWFEGNATRYNVIFVVGARAKLITRLSAFRLCVLCSSESAVRVG